MATDFLTASGAKRQAPSADPAGVPLGQVLEYLARLYDVESEQALRSRVIHFMKLGLPKVAPVGTGKPSLLSYRNMLDLGAMLELTAAGFPPERCATIIKANREKIHEALWKGGNVKLDLEPAMGRASISSSVEMNFGVKYALNWPAALREKHEEEVRRKAMPKKPQSRCGVERRAAERFNLPVRKQANKSLADDLLKGAKAAADYIGITPRAIYRMVEAEMIPHIKKGELLFFRKSELDVAFSSPNRSSP